MRYYIFKSESHGITYYRVFSRHKSFTKDGLLGFKNRLGYTLIAEFSMEENDSLAPMKSLLLTGATDGRIVFVDNTTDYMKWENYYSEGGI